MYCVVYVCIFTRIISVIFLTCLSPVVFELFSYKWQPWCLATTSTKIIKNLPASSSTLFFHHSFEAWHFKHIQLPNWCFPVVSVEKVHGIAVIARLPWLCHCSFNCRVEQKHLHTLNTKALFSRLDQWTVNQQSAPLNCHRNSQTSKFPYLWQAVIICLTCTQTHATYDYIWGLGLLLTKININFKKKQNKTKKSKQQNCKTVLVLLRK